MATELPSPLYSGFFPQMVLTVEEIMHYRRVGKERVAQLVRLIDDADCVYRWTDVSPRGVSRAQFVDVRASSKQPQPSTLLKCSVHLVDVQPEEVLQALAKGQTRDARRVMRFLHGDEFVDTQTLLTFPTSSERRTPSYSYRAIKWLLLKAKRREGRKALDFCYLEYAGKSKSRSNSSSSSSSNSVVGFCVQESIARDREVPTLERYDILRGQLVRTGVLITKTHQANILKVTAIAQIDGALVPAAVRMTMEEIMVNYVAAVHRVKGLLERQRMGRLPYLDEWEWVSTKERKACAVCLRGFYFHRKHHCATCGEVVCTHCAPLRELEEPLDDCTLSMRVCSLCMAQAGSHQESSLASDSDDGMLETTTSTTNVGTETYVGGLRYPKHRGLRRGGVEESLRCSSSQATPVRSPIPPFRQRHHPLSSHNSGYEHDDAGSDQILRAASESARRERRSSVLCRSTLSSSASMSAQAKKEALSKLIEHVRQIRDTINVTISEAEEEEERHSMLLESGRGDPDAGAERYDEIYDRIMKIRETLDVSSSDFDAVLESIGPHDPMRPSDTNSDRLDSDLAFSLSEGTGSEHPSAYESESGEFLSSRSSLLSASVQSLDHQDAGEPLPSPRPEDESAIEEARALEEAMQWVRQSEPTAHLSLTRPVSPVPAPTKIVEPEEPEPTPGSTPTPVMTVSKNRGIERLAQKIGRLHQRLEASQRESENTSSEPTAAVAAPVPPAPVGVPPVVDERDENADDEPEPEDRSTLHRRQSSAPLPALKQARGPAPQPPKEKHVAIAADAVPSSPISTVSRGQGSWLSEPARAPPDLVASLRGVMNSSELTHAPPRRRSGAYNHAPSSSPPETPSNSTPSTSIPSRNAYSRASRRPPPPPPPAAPPALPPFSSDRPAATTTAAPTPVQGTTIYVRVQMKFLAEVKTAKKQRIQAMVATCLPRMKSKDKPDSLQQRHFRRQLELLLVDKQERAMRAASCAS
ncbi:hypothetical protein PF005_g18448 [Phytophthora fragariae]|uniref:FYVE-type domain-containing protein n=1 Tax=Phytophthora fragariae TaxID=53985 RepID=A0A6A3FW48_9STRA|nr:hypothetical protein PF003_g24189 [Phytophthora fragariae]KAE8949729.1 hypothetical protein PF009_g732 [Phytophthora fragariae]KAE8993212.1 hypothetical protein PF011_g17228 [Phytophthora fragariae]KAE9092602.1 hypothetical protein PF007_g18421 [Phytophthora fragariae]KAE9151949.1 hypothetical protein PF006_g3802 [Phytophthora fragariae]